MATSVLLTDELPTLHLPPASAHRPTTPVPLQSVSLLYGLSLAMVLPPAAWLPPQNHALPAISPTPATVLAAAELQAALTRTVAEAGRGQIALREVDQRLHGLLLSLDLFRADQGRGVLIALGIVWQDRATSVAGGATPGDLWRLAREAIPQHGRVRPAQLCAGAESLLVLYGRATTQIAWLAPGYLATVSVTSLNGDERQATEIAYTSARLLVSRLASRACGH